MSRIPTAEWLRIAEDVRDAASFSDKMQLAAETMPNPAGALIALNHEASAIIARLADLVERGSNSILIDKAANALSQWNQSVIEAESQIGGSSRR
jgi:hypothetical protein